MLNMQSQNPSWGFNPRMRLMNRLSFDQKMNLGGTIGGMHTFLYRNIYLNQSLKL